MKNFRLKLSLIFFILIFPGFIIAQTKVTGVVTDAEEGLTLPGVTILEKNSGIGSITNIDGEYSITVPSNAILVFSYVGYASQEITVGSQTIINIQLNKQVELLDEIIIIGYGVQKKSDKTGAVSQVKAEDLSGGVVTDAIQTLQGKSAGVLISKKGGDPNEGFSVRIRGASGFETNTQPLYVVDGIQGVDPTTVAPEDIETFNILKDAASTAIYGSRGANGVIIITTKKGSADKFKVYFNTKVSADQVAKRYDILSADEIREYAQGLLEEAQIENPQYTIDSVFNDGGASTDWQDEIFRTGITQSYNLGFSGGTEKNSYYASITQADWEGVMKGTSKGRTIAKVNITQKALDDRLTLSGTISQTFEQNDYENYGKDDKGSFEGDNNWDKDDIIYQALTRNPTDPVYNEDGSYNKTQRVFNYENPVAVINEIENSREFKSFLGALRADVEIIEGLIGSANIGYIRDDYEELYFRPDGVFASADNGFGKRKYENTVKKSIDITGTYTKTIAQNHNLVTMIGYTWQEKEWGGFSAKAENAQSEYLGINNFKSLLDVKWGDIESWKKSQTLIGFFGRIQYNFNQKYYLSGSLRRDGSSKFGTDNVWGWFPTVAIGWSLHEEGFTQSLEWLDQLKMRLSYGVSGNQEFDPYQSVPAMNIAGVTIDPETGKEVLILEKSLAANSDLGWEQTTEYNLGIDYAVLNTRINGSIDIYYKLTDGLLGEFQTRDFQEVANKEWDGSGEVSNRGIELYLQAFAIEKTNLKWKTSLNFSYNKAECPDLGRHDGKDGFITGRGLVGDENYVNGVIPGEEIGSFYLPIYVTIQDGLFIFESQTGGYTDDLVNAKREVIGTAAPKFEIGWSNSFTFYENWDLDFNFRAWIGNDMFNATEMMMDSPDLPSLNAAPSALGWEELGRISGPTVADIYVEDASFLKLDYLSLGYNFNTKKLKLFSNLKAYFASNNLLTITGYSGIDPETNVDGTSFGIDYFNVYPKTRTFTFGINATF
ncbi:SusC/RagA family TonB-linked outer membrane protein [Bacteroidota bacterium]